MNTNIQGKVVLITGASKGIGKATAMRLAAEGARLALCARDEKALTLTADEIRAQTHADVLTVKANMTKINDIRRFVSGAVSKFDHADILINNAGGWNVGGILTTTDEDWEYHLQLKLLGYIKMAREVIPHMKINGGGKIINVVGMTAKEPGSLSIVQGVINAGLLSFTKSLSKELEADNITVNSINPTTTDTPLTEETFEKLAQLLQKSPEELRQSYKELMPGGKLVSTEDIAKVILFLASDSSSYINGTSINIDAGKSLGLW
jgi:NAD(P)-dependent dehydrogenase (short-subunit alcohol dehydrogenase family)